MGFDELLALILAVVFTSAFVYLPIKNISPFIKQAHRIRLLKERGGLITVGAEVIDVETRDLIGLKNDLNKLYIMRVQYQTEKSERGMERSVLFFVKKPTEQAGQSIMVLYSRDEPSEIMTTDGCEAAGSAMMFIKLVFGAVIAFVIIFAVFYCLCKFGLPDD